MRLYIQMIKLSLLQLIFACCFDEQKTITVWTSGEFLDCIQLKLDEKSYSPVGKGTNFTQFHLEKSKTNSMRNNFYTLRGPIVSDASIECGRLELCFFDITWDSETGWNSRPYKVKDPMAEKLPAHIKTWALDMIHGKPAVIHAFYGPATRVIVHNTIGFCINSDLNGGNPLNCDTEWKMINVMEDDPKLFLPNAIFKYYDLVEKDLSPSVRIHTHLAN